MDIRTSSMSVEEILGKKIKVTEEHLLGLHILYQHGLKSSNAFDNSYDFTILDTCHPKDLDRKEHIWIQKLKCVAPYGLNAHDPFSIPIVMKMNVLFKQCTF